MTTMTRFADGPAEFALLELRRVPLYLRAVRDAAGKWDALDQLDDEPRPGEILVAYRLVSADGAVHIDRTDPRTRRRVGSWHRLATYALVAAQPDEATLRDTARWRAWCVERQAAEQASAE